ncbi:MAG: DUF499 domain-containing protein [Selenomonadaceae bacterium]
MMSMLPFVTETCVPRAAMLNNTFNLEIFTAALAPVIESYRSGHAAIDDVYTNAEMFFRDATYPTDGLKFVLSNVFRRISGDGTAPCVYRMETAFGGGKTHSLIACVHIAERGKELAPYTSALIDPAYLPEPHSVKVVGITGNDIPVSRSVGDDLVPYTLWGELARQIGGDALYDAVRAYAESPSVPGKDFFEKVIGDQKCLIVLDEMAMYCARYAAAHKDTNAADLVASFLYNIIDYSKQHTGIAVIITLASTIDAFSDDTSALIERLSEATGKEYSDDDAIGEIGNAVKPISSVLARDATVIKPVAANEIMSVLGKRLFEKIDAAAAKDVADAYAKVYTRNSAMLPPEALRAQYGEQMARSYPFHPTLIKFLNEKIALAPNFQGTRGVLRTLALVVRSIWRNNTQTLMIQVPDIDLHTSDIVNELLGRTASSAEMHNIIAADIGSADSAELTAGLSNAQKCDAQNPHPDGIKWHELTWRTVYLNSLVQGVGGITSNVFGIGEKDAIFETATPLLAPAQVKTALDDIDEHAYFLRFENEKYFAHTVPTINNAISSIKEKITDNQVKSTLDDITRDLIKDPYSEFAVMNAVKYPQDIPESRTKPMIGVVALDAETVDVMAFITTKGDNISRQNQNMVTLLVPDTVAVTSDNSQLTLDVDIKADTSKKDSVIDKAKTVIAYRMLGANPQSYGIAASSLKEQNFERKKAEYSNALRVLVSDLYHRFYYPNGTVPAMVEIRGDSSESGAAFITSIKEALTGKLLVSTKHTTTDLKSLAKEYFFKDGNGQNAERANVNMLMEKCYTNRSFPMLTSVDVFKNVIREGVDTNLWVLYEKDTDYTATSPRAIYTVKKRVPLSVDITDQSYYIMTIPAANKRHWIDEEEIPLEKIRTEVEAAISTNGAMTVGDVIDAVKVKYPDAGEERIGGVISGIVSEGNAATYTGDVDQQEKPEDLMSGIGVLEPVLSNDVVIISRNEQSNRGWCETPALVLDDNEHIDDVLKLCKHLNSYYTRDKSSCVINSLVFSNLAVGDTAVSFSFTNIQRDSINGLDELFGLLAGAAKATEDSKVTLMIMRPDSNDPVVKAVDEIKNEQNA